MPDKIDCHWCNGTQLPFHKLNIDMYGDNCFLCDKCYQELEKQQRLFEKEKEE